MNILCVSQFGNWFDGALRMKAEGHDVLLWIGDKKHWEVGDGLVDKVRGKWETKLSWADLIVFDQIGFGKYEPMLKENDKNYVGCSKQVEKLEKDTRLAKEFMQKIGIKTGEDKGIGISIGAYFNGKEFLKPYCISFEHKKRSAGNVGVECEGMGTSAFFVDNAGKLSKEIEKCKKYLSDNNYKGYFNINLVVNENGCFGVGITTRFVYPLVYVQDEVMTQGWGEFLGELSEGIATKAPFRKEFAVGVCCVVHSFNKEVGDNIKIGGLNEKNLPHIHLCQIKENGEDIVLAGSKDYVMTCTGSGSTMSKAKKNAYDIVGQIELEDMDYRIDISGSWSKDLAKLQELGYL